VRQVKNCKIQQEIADVDKPAWFPAHAAHEIKTEGHLSMEPIEELLHK
jgi:hypothetical protein